MKCGCDEAGKGPVIGPMIIAVVCGDEDIMAGIGVRDSKMLSQGRRVELATLITKSALSVRVKIVSEEDIDNATRKNELNMLEANIMAEMFDTGNEYVVDCPDVNEERFERLLSSLSGIPEITAKHKADQSYPLVSAASIIAKVTREEEVAKIRKEIGDFGSGYPSDERTITFLKRYVKQNGKLPPHVRKSWKTVDRINKTLFEY